MSAYVCVPRFYIASHWMADDTVSDLGHHQVSLQFLVRKRLLGIHFLLQLTRIRSHSVCTRATSRIQRLEICRLQPLLTLACYNERICMRASILHRFPLDGGCYRV